MVVQQTPSADSVLSSDEAEKNPIPSPPFLPKPTADVVLRSRDEVSFHVCSSILMEASPVLESMILKARPIKLAGREMSSVRSPRSPIKLNLPEDAKTLDTLLRICYPTLNPPLDDFTPQGIESALRAAIEYKMVLAVDVLTGAVIDLVDRAAIQAWAIACRLRLENVAQCAAKALLPPRSLDFDSLGAMEGISAGDYYRLWTYHRCEHAPDGYQFLNAGQSDAKTVTEEASSNPGAPPSLLDIPHANVLCQSSDGFTFKMHKYVLARGSNEVLEKVVAYERQCDALMRKGSGFSSDEDEPWSAPALQLEETAVVLAHVFQGYSTRQPDPLPQDICMLGDILAAATKYGIPIPLKTDDAWTRRCTDDPLGAYLVAATRGLAEYAENAAWSSLLVYQDGARHQLFGTHHPILESTPALAYHRLRRYYDSCRRVARRELAPLCSFCDDCLPPSESESSCPSCRVVSQCDHGHVADPATKVLANWARAMWLAWPCGPYTSNLNAFRFLLEHSQSLPCGTPGPWNSCASRHLGILKICEALENGDKRMLQVQLEV
ncbi:hypothetical protein C8Q77DRAFT_1133442 [Trametes polyzona]|nr:hypothetical protein C8Q77DRAFT_1133442 [Trametes polyzona]